MSKYDIKDFIGKKRVPEEIENKLKSAGYWDHFKDMREKLKADGAIPAEARAKALVMSLNLIEEKENAGKKETKEKSVKKKVGYSLDDFTKKSTTPRKVFDWIYNHLWIEDIDTQEAPSSGAFFHLRELQSSPLMKSKFLEIYTNRNSPTRAALELEDEILNDDGTDISNFLDKIEDKIKNLRSEYESEKDMEE